MGEVTPLASSQRPHRRPAAQADAVEQAVASAVATTAAPEAGADPQPSASLAAGLLAASSRPQPAPRSRATQTASLATPAPQQDADAIARAVAAAVPEGGDSMSLLASEAPKPRSDTVILAAMGEGDRADPAPLEIVSRPADSGRHWGVSLGLYRSKSEADDLLLRSALQDGAALEGARRNVADTIRGFEAKFVNLDKADAELVCERFRSRSQDCKVIGP